MTGDVEQLMAEQQVSWRQYGAAQQRCSQVIAAQQTRIAALEAQLMRTRAACIVQTTALAVADHERASLVAAAPDLPARFALRQRVDALVERVQGLLRERLQWQWGASVHARPGPIDGVHGDACTPGLDAALADSLVAADLVICQTGCLSHGDYWRVQDHCRRTGKACVLVAQPDAVRIVRLHSLGTPALQDG